MFRRMSGRQHLARAAVREVAIDPDGRIRVWPLTSQYEFIYRAACGVQWDAARQCLASPVSEEWSPVDWFRHIAGAVASEYGERLIIGPETVWTNVPPDMRARIAAGGTVDSRYDDLKNRRVDPIDGEE